MFSVCDKSILITGATGYIGRSISLALSDNGAHVFVNSRTEKKCSELVSEIRSRGGKASVACFNVRDIDEIKMFANDISSVDVIINNAHSGRGGTVESATEEDYMSSYSSSVVASSSLVKELLPALRKSVQVKGEASIINIASMYGMVSPDKRIYDSPEGTNPPFYGAAKAALIHWTKYAACELAGENIRVNAISPGPFPSDTVQNNSHELVKRIVNKVPMGRIGEPEELVGPVIFLSSEASSFVTGANLVVDGGWTSW